MSTENFPKKINSEEIMQAEKIMTRGEKMATEEREENYKKAWKEAERLGLTEKELKEIVINNTREDESKIRSGDPEIEFGSTHTCSFKGKIKGHKINAEALQDFFGDGAEGISNKEMS